MLADVDDETVYYLRWGKANMIIQIICKTSKVNYANSQQIPKTPAKKRAYHPWINSNGPPNPSQT